MNSVNIIGHLTKDPMLTTRGETTVCDLRLAYNGVRDKDTVFIDVAAFGKIGAACAENLKKGSKVAVTGALRYSEWTAQDNTRRSRHTIAAQTVSFLDRAPAPSPDPSDEAPAASPIDEEASEPVGAEQ